MVIQPVFQSILSTTRIFLYKYFGDITIKLKQTLSCEIQRNHEILLLSFGKDTKIEP